MLTKDRLYEIRRSIDQDRTLTSFQCGRLSMVEQLIEECDEDTLVVSKLQPMCDVRGMDGYVMIYPTTHNIDSTEGIEACLIGGGLMQTRDGINYGFAELKGWVPKPIYKP